MLKKLVVFCLVVNITSNIHYVSSTSKENASKAVKLPPCRACKVFVESFKKVSTSLKMTPTNPQLRASRKPRKGNLKEATPHGRKKNSEVTPPVKYGWWKSRNMFAQTCLRAKTSATPSTNTSMPKLKTGGSTCKQTNPICIHIFV